MYEMPRTTTWAVVAAVLINALAPAKPVRAAETTNRARKEVRGYIERILPESQQVRGARHQKVAERRKQETIVMVHRGASKFAPENTLEAYAAAMDYGADGVEIDIHRSAEGVLYLLHDETLDRMVEGKGKASEHTYYELLQMPFRNAYGAATSETRIPTLAALVELARQRTILLHLDVKEPGIQDDIAAVFDKAESWDHIVHINDYNSDTLLKHPGLQLYGYKGWIEDAGDLNDPEVVKRFLAKPGKMLFCKEDPRPALRVLGRHTAYTSVPLPRNIHKNGPPNAAVSR